MADSFSEQGNPTAVPAGETIVFLGDSLTKGGDWAGWFPELNAINLGVDGDTTDSMLSRLDGVGDLHPDAVVLMIGTNDFGARSSVEHVVRNIENILVQLRRDLPGARMLLQSIPPRGKEFADRIQDANRHLRQFVATVPGQYLDLWPAFAREDGELNPVFSPDRLHLNEAGYEAWLGELRPALERLHDLPPMTRPIQIIPTGELGRVRG